MTSTAPSRSSVLRWLRNGAVLAAVLVALYALLGFLILPLIAKPRLEALITQQTGRRATIGRLEFNPFTLRARAADFVLADHEPQRTLARFDSLDLDLSDLSIWRRAPVFDAVRLVHPQIELTRNEDAGYNIDDLIERHSSGSDAHATPFSINNIEIVDGVVSFEDRPHRRRIAVTDIAIGIPFLSSFPYDTQIHVTPHFEGAVDGTRFALAGNSTSPFEDTKEATLELNLDALPLGKYAEYVTLPRGLRLADGALTSRLALAFVTDKGVARNISLSGTARVDNVLLTRSDGSRIAGAQSIDVALGKLDWLKRSLALDRIAVDAPAIDVRRDAGGTLEFQRLMAARPARASAAHPPAGGGGTAGAKETNAPGDAAPPWTFSMEDARIANGTVQLDDEAVSPAFRVKLSSVKVEAKQLSSTGKAGAVTASFDADDGAHFDMQGEMDVAREAAKGRLAVKTFHFAKLYPYYASAINLDVRNGTFDLEGDFDTSQDGRATRFVLSNGTARLADLETAVRGERDPFWIASRSALEGLAIDLAKRTVTIDRASVQQGTVHVLRQANGTIDFDRIMRADGAPTTKPSSSARQLPQAAEEPPRLPLMTVADRTSAPEANEARETTRSDAKSQTPDKPAAPAAASSSGDGWTLLIRNVEAERIAGDFEDRSVRPVVKVRFSDTRVVAENVGNSHNAKAALDLSTRIGASGRVHAKGTLATDPFGADVRINASSLDVVPLRPYFERRTNIIVNSAAVGANGRLTYGAAGGGAPRATFKGDLTIANFASLDRPTSQELMRWDSLTLTDVDMVDEPFRLAMGAVALDRFYARLILNADATLNLQQLIAPRSPTAQGAPVPATTTATGATTTELPPSNEQELPVSIGRIQVSNGEVQYSDFFVQPNYSSHLTQVNGSVSALSATQAGDVEATARVEGTAPVDVRGSLNPFARQLQLDLTGKANDIDLPPLTPYSIKYAGYGIQKGKLSLEVHYKVDNRKLAASNKLKLDQLTFGEHVDSPTATKLPVLLAVALLQDRNGVINLNLPIEGTLDDPKFSVWGVIVQIFVNLITKAVTAPFALLGAIAGGGGEQLAYVEFAPGHADLTEQARAKLKTLSTALTDRPALKIDAAGRASPDADREGLKRAMLDRAVRAQKAKSRARQGESTASLDAMTIDADEYPKLLERVYANTELPDKPRNVLGIAKSIPAAEMEAILVQSYRVDDEALTTLANRRAQTVKEWLAGEGGVASERVFIVAPKLGADGIKDSGAPTRVDFAIR